MGAGHDCHGRNIKARHIFEESTNPAMLERFCAEATAAHAAYS